MEIAIPEILKENTLTYGIGLLIASLSVIFKFITGLLGFYEESIQRRHFNRLKFLRDNVNSDSKLSNYITQTQELEAFRLASGIRTNPENAKMLMDIFLLDIASNDDLKRITTYMRPDSDKVEINVTAFDKLHFAYSLCTAIFIFLYGVALSLPYMISGPGIHLILGLLTLSFSVFFTMIVGRDYIAYRILSRVRKNLIRLERISNPSIEIKSRWIIKIQKTMIFSFEKIKAITTLTSTAITNVFLKLPIIKNCFGVKVE